MGVKDYLAVMILYSQFLLLFLLTPNVLSLESIFDEYKDGVLLSPYDVTYTENTLLLGGTTQTEDDTVSMEVITSTGVCTPKLAPIPVARWGAGAVLIHNTILYCGGIEDRYFHSSCHSNHLGEGLTEWRLEPSMVHKRSAFSLSLVGDITYAVDGWGGGEVYHDTVESYTEEGGWMLEGEMAMDNGRYAHCSVGWDHLLVVIGGWYGNMYPSSSVLAINTINKTDGWISMEPMNTGRYGHGCHVWTYEGETGIVVGGGGGLDSEFLESVEFFNDTTSKWEVMTNLKEGRAYHSGISVTAQ